MVQEVRVPCIASVNECVYVCMCYSNADSEEIKVGRSTAVSGAVLAGLEFRG